ncbi:FAD-dependent monooxygenase [Sphingomonas sp. NCPPB 2930]
MKLQDLPTLGADADFQALEFDYTRPADLDGAAPVHHPVVVVGAGPVGLALAIDLAQRGLPVLLLDNDCRLSTGSRAICFAKRTLEVFDRLGCGAPMVAKGVSWSTGRVFFGERQVYRFDLLAEEGHERPAFINLQQYHVEGQLAARAAQLPNLQVRWKSRVVGLVQDADGATLSVETPDGRYDLRAGYVAACDGSRSALRRLLGQESRGQTFRDRFLIADVKIDGADPVPPAATPGAAAPALAGRPRVGADTPAERWFWFDPPFHPGQSVLLHKQADHVWRIDFQLGWDADPDEEKKPEHILPRVRALLGPDARFELVWASVYTFACQRMDAFRHGRVLFAGDAAHGVSPFGARGANSGVQDADNLGWKLAAVLRQGAPDALLDSYAREREMAADENILASTRSTDFITPKSPVSRMFRDAVLHLARDHGFARTLVNSGRLSLPTVLAGSALVTEDTEAFAGPLLPGAPAVDAPLDDGWLLRRLDGAGFAALVFGEGDAAEHSLRALAEADSALRKPGGPARPQPQPELLSLSHPHPHPHPQPQPQPSQSQSQSQSQSPSPSTSTSLRSLQVLRVPDTAAHATAWRRYDARPGTTYLLRPDQHIAARWRAPTADAVRDAVRRSLGHAPLPVPAPVLLPLPLGEGGGEGRARPAAAAPSDEPLSGSPHHLVTTPHLDAPDDFYQALIDAHQPLAPEESHAFNARLVLLLANHIGALPVLREALAAARAAAPAA